MTSRMLRSPSIPRISEPELSVPPIQSSFGVYAAAPVGPSANKSRTHTELHNVWVQVGARLRAM
jgi:hypothetical protein